MQKCRICTTPDHIVTKTPGSYLCVSCERLPQSERESRLADRRAREFSIRERGSTGAASR